MKIKAALIIIALFLMAGLESAVLSTASGGEADASGASFEIREPVDIANRFVGTPYRYDGTMDEFGRFTLFEEPVMKFGSPGLNCSGLVVTLSRYLLGRNFSIEQAAYDRLDDSGPDSPLGSCWDYGWDLVFNLTDGLERRVVLPEGIRPMAPDADGINLRGFDIHDQQAWVDVLPRMKSGRVYLASLSKPVKRRGYGANILHHHVGVIIVDRKGGVWIYHATPGSNTHKVNLGSKKGLARFMRQFKPSSLGKRMILILEVRTVEMMAEKDADEQEGPPPINLDAEKKLLLTQKSK